MFTLNLPLSDNNVTGFLRGSTTLSSTLLVCIGELTGCSCILFALIGVGLFKLALFVLTLDEKVFTISLGLVTLSDFVLTCSE